MMCRLYHGKILCQKAHAFCKFTHLTIGAGIMRAKHHVIGRRTFGVAQRRHVLRHTGINTISQASQLLRQRHHLNVFCGRVGRTRGTQCCNAIRTCCHQAFHTRRPQMTAELLLKMRPQLIAARLAQARYFAPDRDPYEVLLDRYEKGLTIAQCDEFFATLRETIVPLLADIQTRGKAVRTDFLDQEWPIDAQRRVSKKIMELWGLDPAHCYLAESEHPFTTEFWRGDVRITTHYMPRDIFSNLYSVAHEGGHALYELNINPDYDYTVVTHGATMGIHESQSRLFENLVGRSRAFVHYLYPTLKELFPAQLADVSADEIWRAVNRAEPGLIRTEADELTYSLHIMVRYELEKALMQGTLAVADLPAAWNAKYKEYLGVDVPDDAHGCLQDIHWSMGDIGYFPSYALGSAYGAQALDDLRKTNDFDAQWANGDVEPLKAALKERVWQWGSMKEPAWLVESLCGGKFDPHHFTDYLKKKYTELYEL